MTRIVRFFPDQGHRWSLWEAEAGGAVSPAGYGLTPNLIFLLELWTDHWDRNYDPFSGWSNEVEHERSDCLYVELYERLKVELGPEFDLVSKDEQMGGLSI